MRAVKTVLTLFAVIIISVCFAACGGEDEPAPDPGDTPETFTVHSIDGLETFYAIGGYEVTGNELRDVFGEISRDILLEKDGYGYIAVANVEDNIVYVYQLAVAIRTNGGSDDYCISVPIPFNYLYRLGFSSDSSFVDQSGSTLTVTWTAENFRTMCAAYDVIGDYYSVKEYYLSVSDTYDITFDDDTKTIHMNCSRVRLDMSLLFEYDIVPGSTLTFTDDTVTLVMDAGVPLD